MPRPLPTAPRRSPTGSPLEGIKELPPRRCGTVSLPSLPRQVISLENPRFPNIRLRAGGTGTRPLDLGPSRVPPPRALSPSAFCSRLWGPPHLGSGGVMA